MATYRGAPPLNASPRELATAINRVNGGKMNVTLDVTLTANAASTMISDARLAVGSFVGFLPMTANAAAELGAGTLYVTAANMNNLTWTVTHANNAQTDRTFRLVILG